MSSTNKTANFKLSQFIGTDKPTFLGDYNNDMEIIDGALFTASQTAEEAVNDVEKVKGAQEELKAVHEDTKKQVAQLKETADGMTGDVTAAQEAANSAEEKATAAQTAATDVVNAANTASANATKAKQTADGNKTTLQDLEQRVTALEEKPKLPEEVTFRMSGAAGNNESGGTGCIYKKIDGNLTFKSANVTRCQNGVSVDGVSGLSAIANGTTATFNLAQLTGNTFKLYRGAGVPAYSSFDIELTYTVNPAQ